MLAKLSRPLLLVLFLALIVGVIAILNWGTLPLSEGSSSFNKGIGLNRPVSRNILVDFDYSINNFPNIVINSITITPDPKSLPLRNVTINIQVYAIRELQPTNNSAKELKAYSLKVPILSDKLLINEIGEETSLILNRPLKVNMERLSTKTLKGKLKGIGILVLVTAIDSKGEKAIGSKYISVSAQDLGLKEDNEGSTVGYGYERSPGELTLHVCFYWEDAGGEWHTIRYATVALGDSEAWGKQIFDWSWTHTGSTGCVTWGPFENDDGLGQDGYDIFFHIETKTGAVIVEDYDRKVYVFETVPISNHPDGEYWYTFICSVSDNPSCWAFNIYDSALEGYWWVDNQPNTGPPPQVIAYWEYGLINNDDPDSCHFKESNEILIDGEDDNPHHRFPGIILHEYGHFIADIEWNTKPCDFDESPGGGHDWCDDGQDLKLSWAEGWAHAFASMVLDNRLGVSGIVNGQSCRIDVESCTACRLGSCCSVNEYGKDNEVSVAGILWDLYDNIQDDQNGDGVGDSISNYNFWEILRSHCGIYTLDDFWDNLPHTRDMWATFYEHGVNYDNTPPQAPRITCTPPPDTWTNDASVVCTWSKPSDDLSGIKGYSRVWDDYQSTIPDDIVDLDADITSDSHTFTSGDHWYFHIKAIDWAGNPSSTTHVGPFKIDLTKPSNPTSIWSDPPKDQWTTQTSVTFYWSGASDTYSGVKGYHYLIDKHPDTSVDSSDPFTAATSVSKTLSDGEWYLHIRTVDNAGNLASSTKHYGPIKIDTTPPYMDEGESLKINNDAEYTNSRTVTIHFEAADLGSGIKRYYLRNGDGDWTLIEELPSPQEIYEDTHSWTLSPGDEEKCVFIQAQVKWTTI